MHKNVTVVSDENYLNKVESLQSKKTVESFVRTGVDGIAAQGLGGYYTDTVGFARELTSQARRSASMPLLHSAEVEWLPGRRVLTGPMPVEPEILTKRPPFVARYGAYILMRPHNQQSLLDMKVERFQSVWRKREEMKAKVALKRETGNARRMVVGLEDWEVTHGIRGHRGHKPRTSKEEVSAQFMDVTGAPQGRSWLSMSSNMGTEFLQSWPKGQGVLDETRFEYQRHRAFE